MGAQRTHTSPIPSTPGLRPGLDLGWESKIMEASMGYSGPTVGFLFGIKEGRRNAFAELWNLLLSPWAQSEGRFHRRKEQSSIAYYHLLLSSLNLIFADNAARAPLHMNWLLGGGAHSREEKAVSICTEYSFSYLRRTILQ
jgi:hypothetical protein